LRATFLFLPWQKGEWKRTKYVGTSLVDKTLAVIGFGKVRCRLLFGEALSASERPQLTWPRVDV
jgi:hypothetical protein